MSKIVLGFPYDGALLWHLSSNEYHRKGGQPYSGTHPYYQRLYGPRHFKVAPKAASLCVLYDEVIIAPADAGLPDHREYQNSEGYFNPHLGLRTSWQDSQSARGWLEEQVLKDLENPSILACLPEDPHAREFILERTNLQILLALKYDAKILAGRGFFRLLNEKFAHISNSAEFQEKQTEPAAKEKIVTDYFDIACLEFREIDYDRMMALRADKKLQSYARSFHGVLNKAVAAENPTGFFFEKMKSAMERRDILEQVDRGFSTGGAIVSGAALFPKLGPILNPLRSALNISRAALARIMQRDSWVLLGSRMSEVMLKDWTRKNVS